ncbi:hypothetical protein BDB00DRAFT_817259 [Zychaea mexicana]|uniref:uncharacterized protein n=1 Tax=Zychaea mexicana TaxID=64656 RepID=UPI0022FE9871|nr:uncharacterized protein BDB00DRAFT_817259 [Zychaea mexicana]KAI9494836.1 hypothetical protein BDB00DRAFT_817259 [Zychaea mexicana]
MDAHYYHSHRPSLPLTKENLSRYVHQQEETEPSFTLMSRYYNDLPPPSPVLSARRERRNSSNTTSSDFVVATPRLSPFPYHNDSLFLPTAEQQHNSTISSRRSNSPTPSIDTFSSYPGVRRASAAERRPSPLATVPPRRQASAPPLDRATTRKFAKQDCQDSATTPKKARSWWLWLSKLLTIKLKKKKAHASSSSSLSTSSKRSIATSSLPTASMTTATTAATTLTAATCRLNEGSPVWYSQFRANPPPPSALAMAAA